MKHVVIVGAGISGLTTALHLKDRERQVPGGLELTVLESARRPGGNIRTDRTDGFTIEWGPNGYLDNVPTTPALVHRLGLQERVQKAEESAAKRYLYRNGILHLLPSGPTGFLRSPVLSLPARLRVLAEPFARARPGGVDETIYAFVKRRLGHQMASVLIDAMVSGVFAGDIHQLSLRSCFPKMAEMEAEHGGLVRAMFARMKERKAAKKRVAAMRERGEEAAELTRPGGPAGPGGTLTSFEGGLDLWIDSLAAELAGRIRLSCPVTGLERDAAPEGGSLASASLLARSPSPRWIVRTGAGETLQADAVVLTPPSPAAAPLLAGLDTELAEAIAGIPTAGLAVVALGYDNEAIGGAPDGFGFLVPRGTGPRILGCLWDSSVFPGRAPEGKALLRVMIGGAHDPEALTLDDETLLGIVRAELASVMGIGAEPVLTRIYRHPLGIGQYAVGHQERLEVIHERLRAHPGLWVAGSAYYGISMNACIEKAGEQAEEVVSYLTSS